MRSSIEHFAFFLLAGLLPWQFFAGSLMSSTQSIVGNGSLIRKVYFPREILPISTVLFTFTQFILALLVVVPLVVLIDGVSLSWTALLILPLAIIHLLFTIGCALALSALTTSFRDMTHFTELGLMLLFWLTPIVYQMQMAPKSLHWLFQASPLAAFTMAYQDVLVKGQIPNLTVGMTVLASSLLALFVGQWVFRRSSPAFAEMV
jgi:lipopolysaccharide transport system permease protein